MSARWEESAFLRPPFRLVPADGSDWDEAYVAYRLLSDWQLSSDTAAALLAEGESAVSRIYQVEAAGAGRAYSAVANALTRRDTNPMRYRRGDA